MKKILVILLIILLPVLAISVYISSFFGPPGVSKESIVFIVPEKAVNFDVTQELLNQKLIKNPKGFKFLLDNFAPGAEIKPGGYKLNQSMNAWVVLKKVTGKEDLKWVTIAFCPRKEQVGEKLANSLGWSTDQLNEWNSLYKNDKPEYFEGVYYPDTYLIPVDESVPQVAQRFIDHFNKNVRTAFR